MSLCALAARRFFASTTSVQREITLSFIHQMVTHATPKQLSGQRMGFSFQKKGL